MEPLRILVDAHVFDGEPQGTRTFVLGLYRALMRLGLPIRIWLAAANCGRLEAEFAGISGVEYLQLRSNSAWYRLLIEIPQLLARRRFDYAHFQYIAPLCCGAKRIVTIHDLLVLSHPHLFPWKFRARSIPLFYASAKRAHVLTTVSGFSRDQLQRYFGISADSILLTPNGIDDRFFYREQYVEAAVEVRRKFGLTSYVLFVSRFEPRKNQDGLLRACLDAGLYEIGMQLVFAGSKRQMYPAFVALLESLPAAIRQNVRLIEDLSDDELMGLIVGARVFVYPCLAEGFGIPALEAAALCVPTLCSSLTAMRDFAFFGSDHYDPTNAREFAAALRRILFEPPDEEELKSRSRAVRASYSWPSIAAAFGEHLLHNRCKAA